MPRGTEGVRQAARDIQARKESGGGGGKNWFKLGDGETAVVRFLEQGDAVAFSWGHEVPVEGRDWGRFVPCRDQDELGNRHGEPCPGCERNLKRTFKGFINLIWRDAPKLARNSEGRLLNTNGEVWKKGDTPKQIGVEDQVALWSCGITVYEELDGKDVNYRGLGSRDFKVQRLGKQLNTRYRIDPADPDAGAVPMSEADKELAKEKYDLDVEITPPSYEDWGKDSPSQQKTVETRATDASPFLKHRQSATA